MKSAKRNIAESVRARLLNLSKQRGDEFQLTLANYVIEQSSIGSDNRRYATGSFSREPSCFASGWGNPIARPRISTFLATAPLKYRRSPRRFVKSVSLRPMTTLSSTSTRFNSPPAQLLA